MRFSFDWLKRHLNTSKTIDEIADILNDLDDVKCALEERE